MYYYNIILMSIVLILSSTTSINSTPCGIPIQYLLSNYSGLYGASCGVPFPQHTSSENNVEYELSFPGCSCLNIVLTTRSWLTEISIWNGLTSNLSAFSLAYTTHSDAQLSPVQFATLYNASLTAGALIHLERGESRRIKFQNPVQPKTFVIFGYGSFNAEGSIKVQLFGCPPSDLYYPITTWNLLQYSYPVPINKNCNSTPDQVENGFVYKNGMDGLLVDGNKSSNSCLTWNTSSHNSSLPLTFSFYKATSIQTIKLCYSFSENPITNVTIHSPGTTPTVTSVFSDTSATLNFTSPLVTDYIQLVIELGNELTLTEIQMHNSEGENVFTSVIHIALPTITESYLTALIATSSSLFSLLLLSLLTILVLLIILCRSQRNLSVLIRFYDTLTPESLAVYSTIKRTPKSRDYVNMVRFFNDMVANQENMPKSSQPLPSRPGIRTKCTSETSSLTLGDYERVGPVLAEHESFRNSSSGPAAKTGLTHALSNSLTFFNRSKCGVRTTSNDLEDNIIYDSPPQSPDPLDSRPYPAAPLEDKLNLDSRYSVHTASYLEPGEVIKENFTSFDTIPLSVSNHQLYNLARSPRSPSQPHATFHFVEDSDLTSRSNAKQLAGITLSQLNDSISSDSV